MTPNEVAQMQQLAQQRGGSLTTNPHTGLPEANFLDDIGLGSLNKVAAPLIGAGAAYFGMDPITAGMLAGGASALGTGDLSKGLKDGLGVWGGASLTSGLMDAGSSAAAREAAREAGEKGLEGDAYKQAVEDKVASTSSWDKLSSGASIAKNAPMDFLKNQLGNGSYLTGALPLAAAGLPFLMNQPSVGVPTAATAPGYIRQSRYDPRTKRYIDLAPVKANEFTNFYADGGLTKGYADGGPTPDSVSAYDYLTGKTNYNPFTQANLNPVDYTSSITPTGLKEGDVYFDKQTGTYKTYHDPSTPFSAPAASPANGANAQADKGGNSGYGNSPEGRAEREAQMDKLRADLGEEGYAHRNDWIGNTLETLGSLVMPGALAMKAYEAFTAPPSSVGRVNSGYQAPSVVPTPSLSDIGKEANPMGLDPAQRAAAGEGVGRTPGAGVNLGSGIGAEGIGRTPGEGVSMGPAPVSAPDQPTADQNADRESQGADRSPDPRDANGYGAAKKGGLADLHGFKRMAAGGKGTSLRNVVGTMHGVEHLMTYANGGYNLGSYSDGGRLLKGPGDGVSDSIPAVIGRNQPARLAEGEFVVPARIVSELGNGSTDAGAKQLYAMMDRIQKNRAKTIGKNKVAFDAKARNHLPA
jgi:hypothetical protein